jgi:germination protein M
MAINRELRKKRKRRNFIFGLLLLIVLIIFSYLMFNKFIITPLKEKYKEKPVVIKEVPYEEEKKKEVQPVPEEMIEVNLYFSDSQAMYLVPEKRKIPQTTSLAKQVVVELIKGPDSPDLYSTIPEGTRVNEVYIADDIVYVDLSEEVFKNHPGGSSGELMTVYSIVNSLTEISPIKGVQILVEGNERNSLVGHVDISMPLLRDEDWIKP